MRLKNRVTLVTGASSGIGKAIATRFAAEGARVGVNYRPAVRGPRSGSCGSGVVWTILDRGRRHG